MLTERSPAILPPKDRLPAEQGVSVCEAEKLEPIEAVRGTASPFATEKQSTSFGGAWKVIALLL